MRLPDLSSHAKPSTSTSASVDGTLDRYMHLAALNRGVLMTPFHNMALIAPQARDSDIDFHTKVFDEIVGRLVGTGPVD